MRHDPIVNLTAGEISPQLRGRVDIDAYKHAASEMTNWQPLQYGGVRRRFGTEMVYTARNHTTRSRLLPFVVGVGRAYIIEMSNLHLQCWLPTASQGPSYPAVSIFGGSTPYTEAQLRDVRYAQSGNFMVLVHPDHPPYALSRITDSDWWFRPVPWSEAPSMPGAVLLSASANLSVVSGLGSRTATGGAGTFFVGADVGRLITRGKGMGRITAVASGTSATVDVLADFAGTTGNWFIHGQPATTLTFSATTAQVGSSVTITAAPAGFRNGEAGSSAALPVHLHANGGVFRITSVTPDGATLTAQVVRRQTPGEDEAAAFTVLRHTLAYPQGQSSEYLNMYPATVAFHDQRMVIGGLKGLPQTFIGSVAGDVLDFTATSDASDAYQWNIDGSTAIQHMLVDNDLLLLTEDAEYAASGADQSTITNQEPRIRKQSTDGSSGVPPVKVGREHVFVQRSGKALIALGFDISINGYDTHDLTLLAEHITGPGIIEIAFARRPVPTLYCVRSDGKMACLTLDSKQKVTAWWMWQTATSEASGAIESVVSVPLASYDEVWMVVRRRINGATVRYLERIQQTYSPKAATVSETYYQSTKVTGFLLDCARLYAGALSGPVVVQTHLALTIVDVVADGYYAGEFVTASDGKLTLPFGFYEVVVGIPYVSTLTPMPPETLGRATTSPEITVKLHESMGGTINGQAIRKVDENGIPQERRMAASVPLLRQHDADLITGDVKVGAQGWKQGESLVTIIQEEPLPIHILGIIQKVSE